VIHPVIQLSLSRVRKSVFVDGVVVGVVDGVVPDVVTDDLVVADVLKVLLLGKLVSVLLLTVALVSD
jgi:hypothetical protein